MGVMHGVGQWGLPTVMHMAIDIGLHSMALAQKGHTGTQGLPMGFSMGLYMHTEKLQKLQQQQIANFKTPLACCLDNISVQYM